MVTRSSTLVVPIAALLLVVFVACEGESKPTPSPIATPAPELITVDPVTNPAGFLQALPAGERECLERALGSENLEEFISSAEPAKETLQACLSEETFRNVILRRRDTEAQQKACVVEAIGEQAGRELFSGQRQPSSEELDAFAGCGIRWPGSADYSDTLPEASAPGKLGTVAWTY